ncbi:MAG: antiterminator LoaP [Clostridia bacterium]|nr:antiterminator LoaP [Clostridia bacterium]
MADDSAMNGKQWYVLFVKTGSEERIKRDLSARFESGPAFYVPRKLMKERKDGKWHNVIRPLFPGYVLVHGEITTESYYALKEVLDIYFILKDGCKPLQISEAEILPIMHLLNDGGDVIGTSDIIMEGDRIFVKSGPLQAFDGNILSVNHRKGRAKVRFCIAEQEKIVELSVNILSRT